LFPVQTWFTFMVGFPYINLPEGKTKHFMRTCHDMSDVLIRYQEIFRQHRYSIRMCLDVEMVDPPESDWWLGGGRGHCGVRIGLDNKGRLKNLRRIKTSTSQLERCLLNIQDCLLFFLVIDVPRVPGMKPTPLFFLIQAATKSQARCCCRLCLGFPLLLSFKDALETTSEKSRANEGCSTLAAWSSTAGHLNFKML